MVIIYIYAILLLILTVAAYFLLRRYLRKQKLNNELSLRLLLIRLPQRKTKEEIEARESKDFKDEINFSAQLFGILTSLKFPFSFEAAVAHIGEEISFYVAVPRQSIEFVSRQIEGFWKEVQVEPVDDYNIFNPGGASLGIYLKQKTSKTLPIRTYVEANVDTFAPILSGLSKLNEIGEGAAIQILARPAEEKVKKSIIKIIENLKRGQKFEHINGELKIEYKDFENAFLGENQKNKENKIIDEEIIKALEAKISKPLLAVNLRVVASAANQFQAETILESISGGYNQFHAPRRQELKIVKPNRANDQKNLIYQFSFREFDDDGKNQMMILNTEEAASMFHLPASTTDIPKIKWLKSKEAPAPANAPKNGTLIGENIFRGRNKPIYITQDDRRRHIYIVGQTGVGKSTLLVNVALDDIRDGKGVGIIDPHGDLVEKILSRTPKERADDVIIFDPSDLPRPIGLNMLEYDFNKPEQKTFIINEILSILHKLFPDSGEAMGPMFEQYMKNTLLLLMEDAPNEPATLMEVARIFTDAYFRNRKLERIKNPVVLDFWQKEAVAVKGEATLANMTPYITSKFNQFTANDYVRPIIGQPKSSFDFRQIIDERKILLVNLSKGRIGDLNANLLGMILTGKILMAALSRADQPNTKFQDFNLFIDEFQNFTTDSIATILSEARKYSLNLTAAHQFIAQLTEKIRDAVFGNVGNIINFRVGATDAEFLVKQFAPTFNENDLINIDNFNAFAKILINGQTAKPFNIHIPFPEGEQNNPLAEKIKELSRLKYGRDRVEIEEEILKRLRN